MVLKNYCLSLVIISISILKFSECQSSDSKPKPPAPAMPGQNQAPGGMLQVPSQSANFYSYLRCWRCDYDDTEQCVKNFDFTKHKHEPCDGKCLKAFEKKHARTKVEIDKAQMTPTIRKCVSQKEIQSLNSLGINTNNGCHDIRTTKRKHKLYCFCENDLCNSVESVYSLNKNLNLIILFIFTLFKNIIYFLF